MQLGLLAAIAERGGFPEVTGKVAKFEYWSLASDGKRGFSSPVGGTGQGQIELFVAEAERTFTEAAERWLTGTAPFIAKLVPEYALYDDYDQLMRRDEWYGRED
jgi:ATP-dependent helicase/nuclease subunit B